MASRAEEIACGIYKIEIPIFDKFLGTLNSYVIRGSERNLIIDTGLDEQGCMDAMQAGLREIDIDLEKTDLFITHIHPDHLGLAPRLARATTKIYFNQLEADLLQSGLRWNNLVSVARRNGIPEEIIELATRERPGFESLSHWRLRFSIVREDDTIRVGEYELRCIETPGHSRGHLCLYESKRKIFFSGDHILSDITPGIQLWSDEGDLLRDYLVSLEKVYGLDIELMFPGHRRRIEDPRRRIEEIRQHHRERLHEVLSILEEGPQNAFQVGSRMSWDITAESWEAFPTMQKMFAVGEAIAHLRYLEGERRVRRELREGRIVYSLS